VFGIGRPVLLKIVKESRPVRFQPMRLEITQREGKTVVDTDITAELWFDAFRHLYYHHDREPRLSRKKSGR